MAHKGRVLVTGATGVLGWHLCRYLQARGYQVVAGYRGRPLSCPDVEWRIFDLLDPSSWSPLLDGDLEAVLHTAALTSVEQCEREPELCERSNVEATRLLAQRLIPRTFLVFFSTDLVFDGRKGLYKEEEPPSPPNRYARSKVEAEGVVRRRERSVVVRLAKLYAEGSPRHPCFVTWLKEHLQAGRPVPLFRDQYRSPIYVGDVVRGVEKLLSRRPEWDLYHLGGPERCSRLEFGLAYARRYGFDRELIHSVAFPSGEMTPRGKDCSLDSRRFYEEFEFRPRGIEEGLAALERQQW